MEKRKTPRRILSTSRRFATDSKFWLIPLISLFASLPALAGEYSWNVTDGSNWSNANSWTPATIPGAGDIADFTQRSLSSSNSVVITSATVGAVNIGGNKSYTISGGTLTLNNGSSNAAITVLSTASGNNTISSNLQIGGNGNLDITNNFGATFSLSGTIFGAAGKSGSVTITNTAANGIVSIGGLNDNGGTFSLTLTGTNTGKFLFGVSNGASYTGAITLVSGSAVLSAGSGLGTSGTMTIGAGGTLDINGKSGISKAFVLNGSGVNGSGAIVDTTGVAGSLRASIELASDSTFSVGAGALLTVSGTVSGGGGLILQGGGTLLLSSSNSYSGGTTLAGGTLQITAAQGLGATTGKLTLNAGVLDMQQSLTVGALSGSSAALITNKSTTTAVTLTSSFASGTSVYAGSIADGSKSIALTKSGAGCLVLSGSNAYSGVTSITAGMLKFQTRTALYSGSAALWTAGNIQVGMGAALALAVGGASGFTSSDIDVVLSLGTASTGLTNGSMLGLDTSAGDFTYGSAIANTNGGANAIGLIKLGSNTLRLTGASTYTGATFVNAGELDVDGSLAAGSAVNIASGAILAGSGKVNGSVSGTNATISGNGLTVGATTLYGNSRLTGTVTAGNVTVSSGTTTASGVTSSTGTLLVSAGASLYNTGSFTSPTINVASGAYLSNNGTLTGAVSVSGTFGGTGTVNGALTIKNTGNLAPGNSAGITTVTGALTVETGAKVSMQIDGIAGAGGTGGYDQIVIGSSGSLVLETGSILEIILGTTLSSTDVITLIDNESTSLISGTFTSVIVSGSTVVLDSHHGFTYDGQQYLLSYSGTAGVDGVGNDLTLSVVPEPRSWAMIVGGIGLLAFSQRFRRRLA